MDPAVAVRRPIAVRRTSPAIALALLLALAACGDDGGGTATDPEPTSATSATGTPTPTPTPTAPPTVGTYPEFGPTDYSYHLVVSCFCMGSGVPIEVTVVDGEAVAAVYTVDDQGRSGVKAGDPAPETFWLTINDVIEAANDTGAAMVEVEWPAGQDYPSSVFVDQDENTIDEEIGYEVSDVQVG